MTDKGAVLYVSGIDMKDNTPIYDIKPYLSYTDSHEGARSGFVQDVKTAALVVDFPQDMLDKLPEDKREAAVAMLAEDIRPSYQDEPEREYGVSFAGYNIRFRVDGRVLKVTGTEPVKS